MTQAVNERALQPEPSPAYRSYVLFILVVVYIFNFLDRQIIGILAPAIQADLGISDSLLGLLGGLPFAIFYSTLGIPIAIIADRRSRTWIMTIALAFWSAMTAVCGLAQNFWQLFLARMGVGVGEAGGVAPAYSLVSDYFPPEKRARALAIYSFGVPIGSASGIIFGGVIATMYDWRVAFIAVGLAGVALAPLFRLTVKEPVRGRYDGPNANTTPAPFGAVWKKITQKRSFWFLAFGAACSSMMGYGLYFWLPAFVIRSYGEELPLFFAFLPEFMKPGGGSPLLFAAYFYGTLGLIGGIVGIFLGGLLGDKLGQLGKKWYALVPAIAFAFTLPFYVIGVLAPNLTIAFFVLLVPTALGLMWLGPVISAFQHLVTPNMRATASAIFLLINNFIGIAVGTYVLGGLSDTLNPYFGDESLRYAILIGSVLYVVAAILFLFASRTLEKDWER